MDGLEFRGDDQLMFMSVENVGVIEDFFHVLRRIEWYGYGRLWRWKAKLRARSKRF